MKPVREILRYAELDKFYDASTPNPKIVANSLPTHRSEKNTREVTSTVAKVQESQIDHTVKLLVRLHDGKEVEAVIINHLGDPFSVVDGMCRGQRATLCLSSQARCS